MHTKKIKLLFALQVGILTPKSYLGAGSLGEELLFHLKKKCVECNIKFITGAEHSGLEGRLNLDHQRKRKMSYDFVWGLPEHSFQKFQKQGALSQGFAFERGVFAFIVDTNKLPEAKWPKSWKDLEKTIGKNIIVQDARMSAPGQAWLEAIYFWKLWPEVEIARIQKRVFPSWSSSYEAFTKGEGVAVWSYVTSEAYHRCVERKENFRALPLVEGYPMQKNYFAMRSGVDNKTNELYLKLREILLSKEFQKQIPLKNWMFPIEDQATLLPECFLKLPKIKELHPQELISEQRREEWSQKWIVQ